MPPGKEGTPASGLSLFTFTSSPLFVLFFFLPLLFLFTIYISTSLIIQNPSGHRSAQMSTPIDEPTAATSSLNVPLILYKSLKSPNSRSQNLDYPSAIKSSKSSGHHRDYPSAMESYDDVQDALRDVTNNPEEFVTEDENAQSPPDDNEKSYLGPREAGWTDPVPYGYDSYADRDFADWDGMAPRYEWNDEYGDIGPRNEDLEKQLFNDEFMPRAGLRFDE